MKTSMQDVEGKVAFITGGSSGIGLGIARAFADSGMKVAISYRTTEHLDEALKHLESASDRIHAIRVDVTDRPGMERAAKETERAFGKVHVLVNNAGVGTAVSLSDATYDDWDWMMRVNVDGVFNGIHAFLPHIKAHGEGGHIVTTSSIFGLFSSGMMSVYSTTKFAVVGMMEALRGELAEANIGVSVFCPGPVISNFGDSHRNRPLELGDSGSAPPDLEAMTRWREAISKGEVSVMDSFEAGRFVFRGIRNNDLFILSHPEFERGLQDRHEALIASIPRDAPAPRARVEMERPMLRNAIYTNAGDRKRR